MNDYKIKRLTEEDFKHLANAFTEMIEDDEECDGNVIITKCKSNYYRNYIENFKNVPEVQWNLLIAAICAVSIVFIVILYFIWVFLNIPAGFNG